MFLILILFLTFFKFHRFLLMIFRFLFFIFSKIIALLFRYHIFKRHGWLDTFKFFLSCFSFGLHLNFSTTFEFSDRIFLPIKPIYGYNSATCINLSHSLLHVWALPKRSLFQIVLFVLEIISIFVALKGVFIPILRHFIWKITDSNLL